MKRLEVTRSVDLPDELSIARHRRAPELGSRILFLSGGTALRDISRVLKLYTHNSVHLITPFDSGGSSAELRRAFSMLSVGDVRNRLVALADETVRGNPETYRLFSHRFSRDAEQAELVARLGAMLDGVDPLVAAVREPLQRLVRTHLRCFSQSMPEDFDLRGASIGNLVLVGGFLENDRDIDSVIFLFSKLVAVLGTVQPMTDASRHLRATLADGRVVVGQHRIAGKAVPPLETRIQSLELVESLDRDVVAPVEIPDRVARYIEKADLICFPPGSFWTSVVANLLPRGVGHRIAAANRPKVYLPNLGVDPEEHGMAIHDCVEVLHEYVARDAAGATVGDVVRFVLVDTERGDYCGRLDPERLRRLGVEVVDLPLVTPSSQPLLDPDLVVRALLSLA